MSIAVLLGKDAPKIPPVAKELVSTSWYLLFYAMLAFVMVKGLLLVQAYQMLRDAPDKETWRRETTWANWIFGISGLVAFLWGMLWLVRAAVVALG